MMQGHIIWDNITLTGTSLLTLCHVKVGFAEKYLCNIESMRFYLILNYIYSETSLVLAFKTSLKKNKKKAIAQQIAETAWAILIADS